MTAYAVAHVKSVEPGPDIAEYLRRIDATLDPHGGRFLVHGGGTPEVVEGSWGAGVIIIEFPDLDRLHAWWDSPEYQAILPLRTRHMDADIVFVDGVAPGYRAERSVAKDAN